MNFKKTGEWKKFEHMLVKAQFNKLGKETQLLNKMLHRTGWFVTRRIRQVIDRGMSPGNAALTTMVKGSSKPLVDTGELRKSIHPEIVGFLKVFVGVLKHQKYSGKDGKASYIANIARILHEGATIPVTPKMRGLFNRLAAASKDHRKAAKLQGASKELWERSKTKTFFGLRRSTTKIRIPARPFMSKGFELGRPEFEEEVRKAVNKILTGLG